MTRTFPDLWVCLYIKDTLSNNYKFEKDSQNYVVHFLPAYK